MALVVEDGTGKSNANAYVAVQAYRDYCAAHGYDLGDDDEARCMVDIVTGTQFIDNGRTYKGQVAANTQALEFPRTSLQDTSGRTYEGIVPPKVRDAACEAAFMARGGRLFTNADRGGAIVSESIGPISTTYAATAPAQKLFGAIEALLAGFVRSADKPRRPIPSFSPACSTPAFSIGSMDNAGG